MCNNLTRISNDEMLKKHSTPYMSKHVRPMHQGAFAKYNLNKQLIINETMASPHQKLAHYHLQDQYFHLAEQQPGA